MPSQRNTVPGSSPGPSFVIPIRGKALDLRCFGAGVRAKDRLIHNSQEVGVPVGTHTMQTVVFSNDGCIYNDYQCQYLVYKP